MNARERVLATLDGRTPDRVPVDLWLVPELVEKLKVRLGVTNEMSIYRTLGVDRLEWVDVPYRPAAGARSSLHGDMQAGSATAGGAHAAMDGGTEAGIGFADAATQTDQWGVGTATVQANESTQYREVVNRPLAGLEHPEQLQDYPWPNPDDFDYASAARTAQRAADEFATLGPWISLFEVYCSMRSLEEALIDTATNPAFVHAALDRIARAQLEMTRRFLEAADGAVDMVFVSDDMGTQQSLLISPAAFDEFLFPRLVEWCTMVHHYGAKVFFHTDGAAEPLIPRLIEAGIDVLNPIQHVCPGMERTALKAKYGKRLIFHGGVENQRVLPFGTPDEVVEETQACIDELGPRGYIACSCHNAQADTPVENILALVETAHRNRF